MNWVIPLGIFILLSEKLQTAFLVFYGFRGIAVALS